MIYFSDQSVNHWFVVRDGTHTNSHPIYVWSDSLFNIVLISKFCFRFFSYQSIDQSFGKNECQCSGEYILLTLECMTECWSRTPFQLWIHHYWHWKRMRDTVWVREWETQTDREDTQCVTIEHRSDSNASLNMQFMNKQITMFNYIQLWRWCQILWVLNHHNYL